MKSLRSTNCRSFIALMLVLLVKIPPVFCQVQIERSPGTADASMVFKANSIEPSNGWHYLLTNANSQPLLLMVEVYLTYDPEREFNRYITFNSSMQSFQFGIGLSKLANSKVPARAYEFQLYAFDSNAFASDRVASDMLLVQSERIDNYVDAKQDCELGKRIVLGEILLEYFPWSPDQNESDSSGVIQIHPKREEFVAKVSVVIYRNDKN